jgi:Heterodisulfide reductase, subunit A and related polyferredoxins
MNAALELASQGFESHLVERQATLGGNAHFLRTTAQARMCSLYQGPGARVEAEPRSCCI